MSHATSHFGSDAACVPKAACDLWSLGVVTYAEPQSFFGDLVLDCIGLFTASSSLTRDSFGCEVMLCGKPPFWGNYNDQLRRTAGPSEGMRKKAFVLTALEFEGFGVCKCVYSFPSFLFFLRHST